MALDSKIAPAHEGGLSREPPVTTDGLSDKTTEPSVQRKGRKKKRNRRKKGTWSDATTMHSESPATPVVSSEIPDNSEDSTAPDSKAAVTDTSNKKDSMSQTEWEEHSWNSRDPFEFMPTATLETLVSGKTIVADTSCLSQVQHTKSQTQASVPRTDRQPHTPKQEQAPNGEQGSKDVQERAKVRESS